MSAASFLKNLEVAAEFYLFKLELFCYFLSLPVPFLKELLLAWLLEFWATPVLELNIEESFILFSLFFTSNDVEPWFGLTIMTDLLPGLAVSLFLELRCPLESENTWWLSIIQLLCRILLFDSWFKLEFASKEALSWCPLAYIRSDYVFTWVFFSVCRI